MQDIHHQLFSLLSMQHQHRNGDVGKQIITLIKIIKMVMLGHDVSDGYLQGFNDASTRFLNEWEACKMRIFWKVSHYVFLHLCK